MEDGAGWTFHQNRLHFAHQRQGEGAISKLEAKQTSQVGAPKHPLCVDAAVEGKYQPVVPPLPELQRSRRQVPTPGTCLACTSDAPSHAPAGTYISGTSRVPDLLDRYRCCMLCCMPAANARFKCPLHVPAPLQPSGPIISAIADELLDFFSCPCAIGCAGMSHRPGHLINRRLPTRSSGPHLEASENPQVEGAARCCWSRGCCQCSYHSGM